LNNSEKEKVIAKYGNPYSEFVICIQPIQISAHTLGVVNTHCQPWTLTQISGGPLLLWRPRSDWGFGALLKGTSVISCWYREL